MRRISRRKKIRKFFQEIFEDEEVRGKKSRIFRQTGPTGLSDLTIFVRNQSERKIGSFLEDFWEKCRQNFFLTVLMIWKIKRKFCSDHALLWLNPLECLHKLSPYNVVSVKGHPTKSGILEKVEKSSEIWRFPRESF